MISYYIFYILNIRQIYYSKTCRIFYEILEFNLNLFLKILNYFMITISNVQINKRYSSKFSKLQIINNKLIL